MCQVCGLQGQHICFTQQSCTAKLLTAQTLHNSLTDRSFRLFVFIIADDPELQRFIGCAFLKNDWFCPFCNLHWSQWQAERTRAFGVLKNFDDMVRWGQEAAPLTRLREKLKGLQKEKQEKEKSGAPLTELEELTEQITELKLQCARYLRQWLPDIRLEQISEQHIRAFYNDRQGQRYPPIFPELTLFNYSACALHCFLNITTLLLRHTSSSLAGYPTIWKQFKQKLLALKLHNLHAHVERAKIHQQQKRCGPCN